MGWYVAYFPICSALVEAVANWDCVVGFKKNVNRATTQVMMKTGECDLDPAAMTMIMTMRMGIEMRRMLMNDRSCREDE